MDKWLEHFANTALTRSADTAHDLKTPLNVAVLNLELLRMRLAKVAGDDEKITKYAAGVELELRRMARIFDAFFLLSTPPKNEPAPRFLDVAPLCAAAAEAAGFALQPPPATVQAHEARIRQAFQLFFDGAAKIEAGDRTAHAEVAGGRFAVSVTGSPAAADLELTKVFKFYYTDALGQPDLSLATARLIAETYGGGVEATQESDKVTLRLSLPLGER